MKVDINLIKVKKRIREDVGDLTELKESLEKLGLLHPIIVDKKMRLISGMRRYSAAKELGWQYVEVKVVDAKSKREKLYIEIDENIKRKDFTFEELEKVKKLLQQSWWQRLIEFIKKLIKKIFRAKDNY